LRGRGFAIPIAYLSNFGSASGRVPGIAEWYIVPFTYRRRFIAVSWLLIAGLAAILPSVRVVMRWRRWRCGRLPAFLVLVRPTASTASVAPVS
jgi:hypothetical protein